MSFPALGPEPFGVSSKDELLTEVRNLSQAVLALREVMVPREEIERSRRRARLLSALAALAALIVSATFLLLFQQVRQTQDRFAAVASSICEDRNRSNAAFLALVTGIGQQVAENPMETEERRTKTLQIFEAFTSQIKPSDCNRFLN